MPVLLCRNRWPVGVRARPAGVVGCRSSDSSAATTSASGSVGFGMLGPTGSGVPARRRVAPDLRGRRRRERDRLRRRRGRRRRVRAAGTARRRRGRDTPPPSERCAISAMQRPDDRAPARARTGSARRSSRRRAARRRAARRAHAVSRRAHSGRGRCCGEHVGRDVPEHVVGRRDPEVERRRQRATKNALMFTTPPRSVTPARAAAAAMHAHSTSCGRCFASSSGVTVSSTRSGVIEPAASDAASTLLSSSGGRWFARTSGVACASTSLGSKIWFSRPDSTTRANHAWR